MSVVESLRGCTDAMVETLESLVSIESPSNDPDGTAACLAHTASVATRLLDVDVERIDVAGRPHLRWSAGRARVLLLGHLDTVWPRGTVARWPFTVDGDIASGPGAFDMKAGVVQGLWALTTLTSLDGVAMLLTSDEEIGSPSSRALIEDTARSVEAVLVLEPSAEGALKTGRKGTSDYVVTITGRAAHAGLEPHKGINAALELAHQILAVTGLERPAAGTTVTPTVLAAGTAGNVVPAQASLHIDARALDEQEQQRVDAAVKGLQPVLEGARLHVSGGINRPALPESAALPLFDRARRLAAGLGLGDVSSATVGGGSDGNFTAGMGIPTLDGLGAVGGGAHAEGEHVIVSALAERAALVAALAAEILGHPPLT